MLKNLSLLVPEPLYYICLVEYKKQHWYLSLGKDRFYFISKQLKKYLNPPIQYQKIMACLLCKKRKTLMQIRLNVKGKESGEDENENKIIRELIDTYGPEGILNIYNQDRKAAVDSFTCYWQISHIRRTRQYELFPLIEGQDVDVPLNDKELTHFQQDNSTDRVNLKKQFKLPKSFFQPTDKKQTKTI